MALTILYGSSISVKNESLYDTILREAKKHPECSYVLLVPEQASLYTQEEMVRRAENHALMNIDVLTFNRLSYRVFEELREPGRQILDDTGKLMLLRLVVREMENELLVLRKNIRKQGFLEELKSLFSELAQYNVSPERLLDSAKKLPGHPALQRKIGEISQLYGAFLARLHRDYEMAEERLVRLAKLLPSWGAASDTVFALTGFTGFTPPQEAVIEALLPRCRDLVLSADLGSGAVLSEQQDEDSLFRMSAVMCARIRELAIENSIPVTERTVTGLREVSDTVQKIEAGLYRWPQPMFPDSGAGLRIVCAKSPEEEVCVLIGEILEKLRAGYRLRDMAVISGDPSRYHDEMEERMRELSLPVFFDETRSMAENPLFLLIKDLMEVYTEEYSFESVMVLLKNPLYQRYIARALSESPDRYSVYERVCELENFCLARGIRGKSRFEKPFSGRYRRFSEGRLEPLNELRELALKPVLLLHETVCRRGATVGERITALLDFLSEIHADEEMTALSEETERLDLQREYAGSFSLLSEFFDRIQTLLPDDRMTTEAFSEMLSSGIGALRLGLVPPAKDELLVGDLRRTRLFGVRFLYVIGANEGVLPRLKESGGLLSDQDRELLQETALSLAPTGKEENFSAQFYLYRLLTSPSEELFLTYARTDSDGKGQNPATVVGKLLSMFPAVAVESTESSEDGGRVLSAPGISSVSDGMIYAAVRLREAGDSEHPAVLHESDFSLFSWLLSHENTRERFLRTLRAAVFSYQPEKLSEQTAQILFGTSVQESVSRLERFAACPFSHFLNYGLALSERPEYRVDVTDLGTMLHDSIDEFFRQMKEKRLDFSALTDGETDELSECAAAVVTEKYGEGLMQDSPRNRYLRIRIARLVRRTAEILKKQWQAGTFRRIETEVPFGWGEAIDALRLPLSDRKKISLAGRIDRMDTAESDDSVTLRIIDYKSGRKDVDYTKVFYGLQLQLLLYMEAAKAGAAQKYPGKQSRFAGIYYYHIDDPMVEAENEQEAMEKIEKELQLHGVTNSDPDTIRFTEREFPDKSTVVSGLRMKKDGSFPNYAKVATDGELAALGDYAKEKAVSLFRSMQAGDIPVRPYKSGAESGCTYCPYRSVCGFDTRIKGYRAYSLRKKDLSDLVGSDSAPNPAKEKETSHEMDS